MKLTRQHETQKIKLQLPQLAPLVKQLLLPICTLTPHMSQTTQLKLLHLQYQQTKPKQPGQPNVNGNGIIYVMTCDQSVFQKANRL